MRRSKLTEKDMTVLKEQDSPRDQIKQTRGSLRDYNNQRRVELFWDLNDDCKKDSICKLMVDDYEVLIDAEQAMRLLRWV